MASFTGGITFPYSNYRFAWLYESESMVCVLDFHVKLIQHINFVPKSFTYDNMRTVVKAFEKDGKKITDHMKALSSYYNFNIRLCIARKGNEKGHVERSVEFIRMMGKFNSITLKKIMKLLLIL